jgi:hypothetical protein
MEIPSTLLWVKSNAGQGSFYRSQHELVGVFRVGQALKDSRPVLAISR